MAYFQWKPYVPVAKRRQQANKKMEALRKKGVTIQPVAIEGRTIARTFWGKAWCDHLEGFSDFENRLPRGRSYVRNGSVCHLAISQGKIEAKVNGSELYAVTIQIKTLADQKWKGVKQRCAGAIGSLLELLQGRLSDHVMGVVTDRTEGLFPLSGEMSFDCSCPDWARMCKHVAAVLYGVGNRLDHQPELLFRLRGVDHQELIQADAEAAVSAATQRGTAKRIAVGDLSDVFGIDLAADAPEDAADSSATTPAKRAKATKPAKKTPKQTAKKTGKQAAEKVVKKAARKLVKKKAVKKVPVKADPSPSKATKKAKAAKKAQSAKKG
ncbi:MAG: SWIM zinc finger family protein [Patescibacteria group bacterium]|nr:SWIM zinc finger family protein [Patescibacteria group bacterium]